MFKNYWLRRKAIREDAMIVYPLIYGFKTPDKHAFKFVDGDSESVASTKKWKRMEIFSQCPQPYLIFKDDGSEYCGGWSIAN